MIGGNQNWYNFKTALVEHFSCSSSRHGGQEHFKALQHAIKEKKIKARNMDVNTNLVSAAVQQLQWHMNQWWDLFHLVVLMWEILGMNGNKFL